jgi:hypothetical protein
MDMYHAHDATDPLDKIFAMLGMSTDGSSATELTPDYSIPWGVLFRRLITFLLGPKATVKTSNSHKVAVISGKGFVIGKVASVAPRSNKDRDFRATMAFTGSFESAWPPSTWTIHAGVKGVQPDDIFCMLDGATSSMLIRQSGSHFAVIMITITSVQPPIDMPQNSNPRNFVLTWDVESGGRQPQDEEINSWVERGILEYTEPHHPEPVRRGQLLRATGQILKDARDSEAAVEIFQEALDSYSLILTQENRTRVECSIELAAAYTSLDEWKKAKDFLEYAVRTGYAEGYYLQWLIDLLNELRFVLKLGGYKHDELKWRTLQDILQKKQIAVPIKDELWL